MLYANEEIRTLYVWRVVWRVDVLTGEKLISNWFTWVSLTGSGFIFTHCGCYPFVPLVLAKIYSIKSHQSVAHILANPEIFDQRRECQLVSGSTLQHGLTHFIERFIDLGRDSQRQRFFSRWSSQQCIDGIDRYTLKSCSSSNCLS